MTRIKEETKEQKPLSKMAATWKLVVDEHLRRGGKLEDLKIDKTFTRKGRMADKNKPCAQAFCAANGDPLGEERDRLRPPRADGKPLPAAQLHAERPFRLARGRQTVVHDTHALRTLIKQNNDIQTRLSELPLDKLEKLGEMLAELRSKDEENNGKI